MTLERMVGPMGVDTFLNEYLDKKPFLLKGVDDWSDFFSYDALDTLMSSRGARHPAVRLANDGIVPPSTYSLGPIPWGAGSMAGLCRPDALYELVGNGTSIVYDDVARVWEPIARGARSLEQFFHATAFASSFFTPAGTQTFHPHFDVHQTFLVQCEGAKHWKVWGPDIEKPYRFQKCPPQGSEPGMLLIDEPLEKGDVLYIPRGFVHAGRTVDQHSLHVSFVVTPFTWFEVLRNALKHWDDPMLDEPVRVDLKGNVELSDEDDIAFDALLERFAETTDPAEAFDRLARVFIRNRWFLSRGVAAMEHTLSEDTPVRRRPDILHRFEGDTLMFHHIEQAVPAEAKDLLSSPEAFPASRIGLDLAVTLHDEGFLEVVR